MSDWMDIVTAPRDDGAGLQMVMGRPTIWSESAPIHTNTLEGSMTNPNIDYSRSNLGQPIAANDNHKKRTKPKMVRTAAKDDPDHWSMDSMWHRVENGVYGDDE